MLKHTGAALALALSCGAPAWAQLTNSSAPIDLTADQLDIVPLEISEDGSKAKVYLFDVYGRGHAKFYQEVWVPLTDGATVVASA